MNAWERRSWLRHLSMCGGCLLALASMPQIKAGEVAARTLPADPAVHRMLERLRRQYGLTPAETALALAVAGGAALREYADERGVTVGTVRFQMKQVLAKTECRRQTDLVRLIGGGGLSMSF